jgi:integrase
MATSGLREGALPSLKIRDLHRIEKYSIFKVNVYDNDQGEYITFCSPRCAKEIDSYLEYRHRHNEYPLNEDAPLIREEFDIYDEIKAARPKPLGVESFRKMIEDIGLRSGVIERRAVIDNGRGPRRPVRETHGFRKAFHTTALNAGMSPLYAELLLGHTSGLSLESYMRPTETELLEGNDRMIDYAGIIDALPPLDESQKLRREVEHYKVKASQFETLRAEIDQIKALINK